MTEDLKYPVGKYQPQEYSKELHEQWLNEIKFFPNVLENAVTNLDEHQLQTPYREGGWTVHQVVHHVADSHMNAYIRFKLGYSSNNPTINAYDEKVWADLADVQNLPINISLTLLHSLHRRWHEFLKSLSEKDLLEKTVVHPEHQRQMTLWFLLGLYAWHGKHHAAHIKNLRERMKW